MLICFSPEHEASVLERLTKITQVEKKHYLQCKRRKITQYAPYEKTRAMLQECQNKNIFLQQINA